MAAIFFTSGTYTRNVIPCSFICVYNNFFTLEFLNLRVDNTPFFLCKRKIVATILEGYFIEILIKPILMISSMKVSLVYFFQCFNFPPSRFSTSGYRTSVGTIKLQSLCFLILTFSTSSLPSCMSVLHVSLYTPCTDFQGFLEIFPSFLNFV